MRSLVAVLVLAAGVFASQPALVPGHAGMPDGHYSKRVTHTVVGMFDPAAELDTSRVTWIGQE